MAVAQRERTMDKAQDAFRTISEVAKELGVPKHVLRFWEGKFPQIKPMKRGGGRRYYRLEDLQLLSGIRTLLHAEGYTIKGVQKILRERGVEAVKSVGSTQLGARQNARPTKRKRKPAANNNTGSAETTDVVTALAKARLLKEKDIAQLDDLIRELEDCRALLVGERLPKAVKPPTSRKTSSARSA